MEVFKFVFSPIEVNTYILADPSGYCAIIDCGCYTEDEFERLTGFLDKKRLTPMLLLNTHCHIDHVFGNWMMLEKYNLRAYCHKDEEKNRKNAVQHALFFGLRMKKPPEPEGTLVDGQELTFSSEKLKVLHVPGHTTGSIAFYCEKEGIVFTGDALFAGSIGRTDLPGGDYETLIESIRSKLLVLPPATVVYSGHGESTTIGEEMKYNPYLK